LVLRSRDKGEKSGGSGKKKRFDQKKKQTSKNLLWVRKGVLGVAHGRRKTGT